MGILKLPGELNINKIFDFTQVAKVTVKKKEEKYDDLSER